MCTEGARLAVRSGELAQKIRSAINQADAAIVRRIGFGGERRAFSSVMAPEQRGDEAGETAGLRSACACA